MKKYLVVFKSGAVLEFTCVKLNDKIMGDLMWKGGEIYKVSEIN